jgi:hypothetical protein
LIFHLPAIYAKPIVVGSQSHGTLKEDTPNNFANSILNLLNGMPLAEAKEACDIAKSLLYFSSIVHSPLTNA